MKWYEKLWIIIKRKWWYLFVLICCSVYVWYYRFEIYDLSTFNAQDLIFILWLILLIFPLFSEIEFMGVKVKKEVEKAREEVKSSLQNIQSQIMQIQLNNSFAANIKLDYSPLPSEQKMDEMLQIVRSMKSSEPNTGATKSVNQSQEDDKTVYLFKSRLGIETALRELCEKVGCEEKWSIMKMVQILLASQIINGVTSDLINQVNKIATRGIHGEIISDEYILFVKEAYPEIQRRLKAVRLPYVICPKCNYSGYSTHENFCPKCGSISDE